MFKKSLLIIMLMAFVAPWTANAKTLTVYPGNGSATNNKVPIYGSTTIAYKTEFIIPSSLLEDMVGGTITKLTFYSSNSDTQWNGTHQIWLKEVNNTTFSTAQGYSDRYSFIGTDGATKVYEGSVSVSYNKMILDISGFSYSGGNLLVCFYHPTYNNNYPASNFYGESSSSVTSIGATTSGFSLLTAGFNRGFMPKTTFEYCNTYKTAGNWSTASNWSMNSIPTSSDDVIINAACAIPVDYIAQANNITLGANGSITIKDSYNPSEDGGQLICTNSVTVTVEKHVDGATSKDAYGWYTISSPVNNVEISSMTDLLSNNYDLYRYDEASMMWENYKNDSHDDFTNMTNGRGYLYRNSEDVDIQYTGNINVEDVEYSISYTEENELDGFNLIGNPFTHDIYKGKGGAIDDTKLNTGFYRLSNSDSWEPELGYQNPIKPGEGILVQANESGILTITNTNELATDDEEKANHDNIMFTVANSEYSDIAYAMFDEGLGLNKIEHRNANVPMLYIPQNDENFAIAMMSDGTKVFDLNFKAMTMGRYTLRCKTKGNFSYLHLIDRLTGDDVDMLLEDEYTFTASKKDAANRFVVRLDYSENPECPENSTFAWQNGDDIIVTGEGELQVFDAMGRNVSTIRVSGETTITAPSMQGVYIFKLNEKSQKIVVK